MSDDPAVALERFLTDAEIPFERLGDDRWSAMLAGERKKTIPLGLALAGGRLVVESFFMRAPQESHVAFYEMLLRRNLRANPVAFALDTVPERRALAERFGAVALDPGSQEAVTPLTDATAGRGADAVLEAVGSAAAGRLAWELVRPGGTISVVGVHTEERIAFSPAEAYDKNLTLRVGRCPARSMIGRVLPLLREGRHDVASIVSHRLPLAEGPRGYEMFDRKQDGCTKVVLTP